ncbi:ABC transporter substrate-binding protein [Streptomyces sp. H27-D2]|uniref:ABC transporter substrate-binding protein n=1 Tax=Streptomyces sp. H27-D2 TaxID=3046304 RepID=UPI002DBCBA5D|nr:iron-siderophore ABC transporter substrate-binding protein [Streptomyces sp. H27-D2]MEC4016944.1 iron-siderophore ABC transporter substrate-binding protein [Streptomyces sp. H27-D2]
MSSNRSSRARLTAAAVAVVASALALTACGSGKSDSGDSKVEGKGAEIRTVKDATGKGVKIPAAPKKVVVLSEMDLDTSLALGVKPIGLTAGRGQQGAPEYLGDKAKGIPVIGAVTGPDLEKVAVADPDVILAGQTTDSQVLKQLQHIAPTVVTIGKDKSWKSALALTGDVLGKDAEAKKFLAGYDKRAAAVKKAIGGKAGSTASVARYSGKGTAVMQQGVFISDVLKDLGFKRPGLQNEKGAGHSTPISDEDIKQIDGDWLFIGTLASKGKDADLFGELKTKPAYKQLGAVKDGHVTEIDGSKWTSLGGSVAAMSVLDDVEKAMAK